VHPFAARIGTAMNDVWTIRFSGIGAQGNVGGCRGALVNSSMCKEMKKQA
jgi:hypothetical protein